MLQIHIHTPTHTIEEKQYKKKEAKKRLNTRKTYTSNNKKNIAKLKGQQSDDTSRT